MQEANREIDLLFSLLKPDLQCSKKKKNLKAKS
jgi:hypothetical protein